MNAGTVETNASSLDLSKIKRGPIVAALIIGAFVAILNETLLNIAFPDLMIEFNVTAATIQWLSTAYMLVIGILVPVTALLQQWFTTRQMFLSAMILFLVGTIICGVTPSFEVLLVGRVIQAIGTGLMLPVMMNTILAIYPPESRGGAMGMIGLVIMFGPAIGPTLAGLLIDQLDWRWLFYAVIPLAAFSVIFAFAYLKNVSDLTKPKVDIISILLSTIGFGGIVYSFSKSGEIGWGDPEVYWTLTAGIVGLILFIWRQLVVKEPILDLRAFKYPMFSLVTVLMLVMMMTMFSTMIIMPIFLQSVLLMTAFKAGLTLMPGGIVNGIMAPVAGKLFDKFGPKVLVIPGLVLITIATWLFSGLTADWGSGHVIAVHIVLLVGISLVMMPAQTTALNQLPRQLYPHGTAIMNTLQQVAGAIGTALFISIMSSGTKDYIAGSKDPSNPAEVVQGLVAGMNDAFVIALVISVLALILGVFIKRTEAPKEEVKKAV
ncbi:DHA2 family lincomycin resistance protein-like MFS transporter [Paenibacillus phyllosphaerae]|uniref:DHA2 family lincomycin resistance protein-like MFS transporter n=1 Tax=Paenibacillus phyllosphaerae TaxID=274593 RepID=A0A7W5B0W5_9BACL|nr:MDR family MFS transporter [Paenibacillus phyllosphaerae]MBB3112342.1 DHA2 family lincomycin resistance protein-like MFS transporter [Paenibacillus phyllosphaerae]